MRIRSSCVVSGEVRPFTMPMVTGKKHRYIEISDFGTSPVKPMEPSTTITIGAMARIGMVWDAMIHGIRLFDRNVECTMAIASATPSSEPSTKPTSVEESVIQP